MRTFVGYPALTLRANPIQAVVTDLFAGFSWPTPILVELLFQPVIAQQPEMKRNCHYFRAVTLLHKPTPFFFTVSRLVATRAMGDPSFVSNRKSLQLDLQGLFRENFYRVDVTSITRRKFM